VFGRLAGYEDVNDADRLCRDPTIERVHTTSFILRGCFLVDRLSTFG
jgi:hypothetical protein